MIGVPESKLGEYTTKGLLLGVPGTGKTTILKKIAAAHMNSGGRLLVIPSSPDEESFNNLPLLNDPRDINNFTGARRIYCTDSEEFGYIAKYLKDCMLISDDFRGYLPVNNLPKTVRQLFISARHRGVHLYLAAHGFTQVPPEMFDYVNLIVLFRTGGNPRRQAQKFLRLEELMEMQSRVNSASEKDIYHFEIMTNF